MSDFVLDSDDDDDDAEPAVEAVLPTFVVLARFRQEAESEDGALSRVRQMLAGTGEPFDDIAPERDEGDGAWMVNARFVVVSVDSNTAVTGVHETLQRHGLAVDEVWADAQVA
jgi:hypothetical protein